MNGDFKYDEFKAISEKMKCGPAISQPFCQIVCGISPLHNIIKL